MPKMYQHVTVNTRQGNILDHCYTSIKHAYKSLLRPAFGKSDHNSVFLMPAYKQKIKQTPPMIKTVQRWSDESDFILQDCFESMDWPVFKQAAEGDIDEYADTVLSVIKKCIDDVVPTKTIKVYPNDKPWLNTAVRVAVTERDRAFRSGEEEEIKRTHYALRKTLRTAKRQYASEVEANFASNNSKDLWHGLRTITDCKPRQKSTGCPQHYQRT